MFRKFIGGSTTAKKKSFIVFIILFNSFIWFYITLLIIDKMINISSFTSTQIFVVWTAYYMAIIISGIVGSILSIKTNRIHLLYLWMILGVVTSSLPAMLTNITFVIILSVCILLGISFGLGMPSCLAYFADCTLFERRGRTAGIILLITNLSASIFIILFMMFNLTVTESSLVFTSWRAIGLITLFFGLNKDIILEENKRTSFASILFDRTFMLYFVAWFMFCFVDRFEGPILRDFFGDFNNLMNILGPIIGSLSAFFAGILSDRIGRKRVILYGFATLGFAYAIMGLVPTELLTWYIYMTIDSISTGILWVNFLLILWGDLSQHSSREKYYAIGIIPFFFTTVVQEYLISVPNLMNILPISAFSMAAFFLFLAVLPLLYAPETLPEKKIELRRLRKFAEEAKKVKEKYDKKMRY